MGTGGRRLVWALTGVIILVCAGVTAVHAQRIWGGYYGRTPPKFPTATTFDGSFHFCRILFSSNRREKQGWDTDYPGADLNFSVRLAELTKVRVKFVDEAGEGEVPDAVVVRLTDDALFHCPFTLMEDAGTAHFSDVEVARLRQYLVKGGFLFVSDYHGTWGQAQFDAEIRRVLPPNEYPIVDLTPPNHAIWNTFFPVTSLPQLASIQTWRRTGG